MSKQSDDRKIFIDNLKTLKTVFTVRDICKQMNIDESTYHLWCKGNRVPKISQIIKLAQILNVPFEDLYLKRIKVTFKFEFEKVGEIE